MPTKRTIIKYLNPVKCDYGFLMKQLLQLKNDITELKNAPDCMFPEWKSLGKASIKNRAKLNQEKQSYAGQKNVVKSVNDYLTRKVAGKPLL